MFKFSSIKKVSSKNWLIQESKNYTKLASIYDKLNNFIESDRIYADALAMIRLAQEQEDVKEPDAKKTDVGYHVSEVDPNLLDPELDIYHQFKSRFLQPGYDLGTDANYESIGLDPGKYNDKQDYPKLSNYNAQLGNQINVINAFIEALSIGGNNVLMSLKSLSPVFAEWVETSFDSNLLKCLDTALANYYKNPLFVRFEVLIGKPLYSTFQTNLLHNEIDATTVKLIEDINKQKQLRSDNYNIHLGTIKRILSDFNIPSDDDVMAYFYRLYLKSGYDEEIITPVIRNFNYNEFKFAKIINPRSKYTNENFAKILKIVEYLGIDIVKKYMESNNIPELTEEHFSSLLKFKSASGEDYNPSSLLDKNLIIPYIRQISELLIDVPSKSGTRVSYMDIVAMKSAFTPEEFAQKVKDGVIRLNTEASQSNIFYISNLQLLSKLSEEDINYLEQNIRSFNKEQDIITIKLYLDRGKEVVPFIQSNSPMFKFITNESNLSADMRRNIKRPPLFDIGLFYDYCVKYGNQFYNFPNPCDHLNIMYSVIGPEIIDFNPIEIMLLALNRHKNADEISGRFPITPELIIKNRDSVDLNYLFGHPQYAYELTLDLKKAEEERQLIKNSFSSHYTQNRHITNFMLFSFGRIDPDWLLVAQSIEPNYEFSQRYKQIVDDRKFFIGNIENFSKLTSPSDIHKDSLRSLDPTLSSAVFKEKYNKVQESMARTPAYSNLEPGTFEYEKVFLMIYLNFWARNRNASIWSSLFDDVINSRIADGHMHLFDFESASKLLGNDLRGLTPKQAADIKENISYTKSKIQIHYFEYYRALIYNLKYEDSVNDITKENVLRYFEQKPHTAFMINVNSVLLDNLNDLNEIENKFTDYYIENYIKLTEDMGLQYYNRNNLGHHLETNQLSDEEFESILRKLINDKTKSSNDIIYPKYAVNNVLSNLDFGNNYQNNNVIENLTNASILLQIFNNRALDVLNNFAKRKYSVNYSQLDTGKKSIIIHDLANILPDNSNQNFVGFAEYFLSNYNQANKRNLRLIGNNWSSYIKLFDNEWKLIGDNYLVRNLASSKDPIGSKMYDVQSLAKAVKISSMSEIIEDVEDPNEIMLDEFCNHYGAGSDENYSKQKNILLFTTLQEVYIKGLNVPLPDWASFDKTIQKDNKTEIRLRFLPRDDVRGMFLGQYAECCQHPTSFAASCALDGHLNPDSAFMVFEINGELGAEGYVWTDLNGNLVIDSLETIGNDLYHSTRNKQIIKKLLSDFSSSLGKKELYLGKGPIMFDDFEENDDPYKNSDTTYIEDYDNFLSTFTPYGNTDMYSDAESQSIVPKST